MKHLMALALVLCGALALGHETDLEAAKKKAAAAGKDILLVHTGPSWCPPCQDLEKEVFREPKLLEKIEGGFVVLYVELFRRPQTDEEKAINERNKKLREDYPPLGYPTVFQLNAKGESYHKFGGFRAGGAEKFVANLFLAKEAVRARDAMNALLEKAKAETDGEKKLALVRQAEKHIPKDATYHTMLIATFKTIADIDADGKLSLRAKYRPLAALVELRTLSPGEDPDKVLDLTQVLLEAVGDSREEKATFLQIRAVAFFAKQKLDDCLKTLKQLDEVAEDRDAVRRQIETVEKLIKERGNK